MITFNRLPDLDKTSKANYSVFLGDLALDATLLQFVTGGELRFQTGVYAGYRRFSDFTETQNGVDVIGDNDNEKKIGNKTALYWLAPETGLVGVYGSVMHFENRDNNWSAGITGKYFTSLGGMDVITELSGGLSDLSSSDTKAWEVGSAFSVFPSNNFMIRARASFKQLDVEKKIFLLLL